MERFAHRFTRRHILQLTGETIAAAVLTGCGSRPATPSSNLPKPSRLPAPGAIPSPSESNPQEKLRILREQNKNQLPQIKDKPLMLDQDFNQITGELKKSSSPFLQLMSRSLEQVWNSENNPTAFPVWINEASTPMAITQDNGKTNLSVALANFAGRPNQFKMISPLGKESLYAKSNPVILGLHLGLKDPQEGTPAQRAIMQGIPLVKEWINAISLIPVVNNLVPVFGTQGYRFVSINTNEPLKGEDAVYAGLAVFTFETADHTRDFHNLVDGFPIALVSTQIEPLVASGFLPGAIKTLGSIYMVASMLTRPQTAGVRTKLTAFVDRWTKSGNIIPPNDYLLVMLDPEVVAFTRELQKKLLNL